jgi:hypothetical protein
MINPAPDGDMKALPPPRKFSQGQRAAPPTDGESVFGDAKLFQQEIEEAQMLSHEDGT